MMKRRWSKSGGFTDLRSLEESSSEVTSSSNGLVPSSGLSPNSLDSHDYGDQDWLCNDSYNTYQQSVITSAAHSCVSLPSQTTIIPLPPNASSQSNSSLTNGSGGGGATNFGVHPAQPGGAGLTGANLAAGMSALSGLSLITSNGSGACGVGSGGHLNGTASNTILTHGLRMDQNGHAGITILASHQQGLSNGLHNNSQNGINGIMQQHTPRSESVNSISSGREDLSPSSSLNGYSTNEGCDAKKSKKGPAPRLQEELCLVCGDRASGYHYNALTCEGCKGFFRRSVTKNATYCCKFGHACEMDMYMRRKCQECRLKKCLAVGMRPECVVPENQCAIKRREKKAQKEKDKHQTSPSAVSNTDVVKKEILDLMTCEPLQHTPCPLLPDEIVAKCKARNIPPLTLNQLTVIYKLIWYQDGYEQPSEEDLKRIMSTPDENESPHDVNFRHITEITILTVQLIVEFAKGLPAFTKIPQEDQITLLKACSSEVMMLRMARRYDHSSDSIFFANNRSYTRDAYKMAGVADNIEDLLHFCRIMYAMKVDNVEYALLTAIVIFSDRPGLEEAELVETIQSYYIDTLRMYILNRHCGDPMSFVFFAKLLSILTELRTLGNQNAEMCFSLKLKNRKLPKFLEEIWDVHAIPPSVQSHIQATQAEKAALESVDGVVLPASAASSTTSLSSASVVGPGGVCALDGGVSLHSTDGSLTVVAASSTTAGVSVSSPSAPSSSSNIGGGYSNIVSPLVVNPAAAATGLNGGIAMYGSPHEALSMIGVAMKQEHMLTDENSTMA